MKLNPRQSHITDGPQLPLIVGSIRMDAAKGEQAEGLPPVFLIHLLGKTVHRFKLLWLSHDGKDNRHVHARLFH